MKRLFLLALLVAAFGPGTAGALARTRGDVSVLALIPSPGYPALPHVMGSEAYEGTYDNPAGDSVPSRVLEYSGSGTLLRSWTVSGQDLSKPHGIQGGDSQRAGTVAATRQDERPDHPPRPPDRLTTRPGAPTAACT